MRPYYERKRRSADGTVSPELIRSLFLAQDGLCSCGAPLAAGYHKDHIIPLSRGGAHTAKNIQLLCPPCNIRKCDRLPAGVYNWNRTILGEASPTNAYRRAVGLPEIPDPSLYDTAPRKRVR